MEWTRENRFQQQRQSLYDFVMAGQTQQYEYVNKTSSAAILNKHLEPTKNDIRAIKQHGVSQDDLKNMVDPLRKELEQLQDTATNDLEDLQIRATKMENTINEMKQDMIN
ncbi:unnamed protein product, partial [Prorocentrum cordatum]